MSLGLSTHPRPNLKRDPLDLWSLERQSAGIDPAELIGCRHERSTRERIEFLVWWALIGVGIGFFWYLVSVAVRLLVRGAL